MEKDFYKILGISDCASDVKIKMAYRKLAFKYHPDRNNTPQAEEQFKGVVKAYTVLSDRQKRFIYDFVNGSRKNSILLYYSQQLLNNPMTRLINSSNKRMDNSICSAPTKIQMIPNNAVEGAITLSKREHIANRDRDRDGCEVEEMVEEKHVGNEISVLPSVEDNMNLKSANQLVEIKNNTREPRRECSRCSTKKMDPNVLIPTIQQTVQNAIREALNPIREQIDYLSFKMKSLHACCSTTSIISRDLRVEYIQLTKSISRLIDLVTKTNRPKFESSEKARQSSDKKLKVDRIDSMLKCKTGIKRTCSQGKDQKKEEVEKSPYIETGPPHSTKSLSRIKSSPDLTKPKEQVSKMEIKLLKPVTGMDTRSVPKKCQNKKEAEKSQGIKKTCPSHSIKPLKKSKSTPNLTKLKQYSYCAF